MGRFQRTNGCHGNGTGCGNCECIACGFGRRLHTLWSSRGLQIRVPLRIYCQHFIQVLVQNEGKHGIVEDSVRGAPAMEKRSKIDDILVEQGIQVMKRRHKPVFTIQEAASARGCGLDDILKAIGQLAYMNIELTNYATPLDNLPLKVSELIKNHNLHNRVFFSSFNPIALIRIRKLLPEIPIGLLALPGKQGYIARTWIGMLLSYTSLNVEKSDATQALIKKIHARGNRVLVYTVNDKSTMQSLFSLNVDGIFTDDPILARHSLEKIKKIAEY